MSTSEQASFDVVSYPIRSITETIVIDEKSWDRPDSTRRFGRGVLKDILYCDVNETRQKGYPPETTTIISNTIDNQALDLGMGVVHAENSQGLHESLKLFGTPDTDQPFYSNPLYTNISHSKIAKTLFKPGEINIVGFVGRTGAGKSTTIRSLIKNIEDSGGHASLFEVDAFFKRSRQERKAWLAEPDISEAERANRKRVVTWWDLAKAVDTLLQIDEGKHVQLSGLYDMQQGGEMVGKLDINPNENGHVIFVEGTALLLPEFKDSIDSFVYINTHDQVRTQSLLERNLRDGYTPTESASRKTLTDTAETTEHIAEPLRKDRFRSGKLTVFDNTARTDELRLMPPYIPRH